MPSDLASALILAKIEAQSQATAEITTMMKVRRLLTQPGGGGDQQNANYTGTYIPAPFNQTSLALRTKTAYPQMAAQYYESRISANRPEVEVIPLTARSEITITVDRRAGEQERLDAELLDASGIRQVQRTAGWAMSTGGVAFIRVLPRDADWGLPSRTYYDELTDQDVSRLKREGKITPVRVPGPNGKMVYAERGDVWAARRKDIAKARAVSGLDLFSLRAYPRDMVVYENDGESSRLGPKWICSREEIPGGAVAEGSELAVSAAKRSGVPLDDQTLYGIYRDKSGQIVGGISRGVPEGSEWTRPDAFTLLRYSDRLYDYIYIASRGSTAAGAMLVYKGEHGCTVMGAPANPFVEAPFFRTDVDYPRQAYSTPLDQVFSLTPLINQLMTLRSNAAAYNLLPRWVVELKDGSILRGEDGEPKIIEEAGVPGLSPNEATAWPGTLKQLTIETADTDQLLKIYLELIAQAMPSGPATGASGETTAWGTQEVIQQANALLEEPVENFAIATKGIVHRMHGWLRELDTPIQFYPAPGHRRDKRTARGLIEFDPKDITDSIKVTQSIETDSERTVRIQIGQALLNDPNGALITREQFYDDYMQAQDARQMVIDGYVEMIVDYTLYGKMPVAANPQVFPQSLIVMVADGVRGRVHLELLATDANYADTWSRQQASQAMQPPTAPGAPPAMPGMGGAISQAAGISQPGMGQAPTLQGQLGAGAPGASPMMPAGAPA